MTPESPAGLPRPAFDPRALAVLDTLERAGYRAVLVGGCVRDWLLSRPLHDYDAATSAAPEEMLRVFDGWKTVPTGLRHGTLTVFSSGLPVEVTTFRTEGAYSDHRHPDGVAFTSDLEADLARRDFTINAMSWGRDGLTDPFGGRADLGAGLLRCVGDPERRFREDALRMLRCLRFSAQLGFAVHPDTAAALERELPLLDRVSRERVAEEFIKLLCAPDAVRVLLDHPQAVVQVIPELGPAVGFDQRTPYHCYDVYTHCVYAVGNVPPDRVLRLAALLHDVGKPAAFAPDEQGVGHFPDHARHSARLADAALRRLRLDSAARERVVALVSRHGMRLPAQERVVRRWLSRLGPELFFDLMELDRADGLSKGPGKAPPEEHWRQLRDMARQILEQDACLSLKQLAVNGDDALAAGLRGPEIGKSLNALLDDVVEGRRPNRRPELLAALEQFKQKT